MNADSSTPQGQSRLTLTVNSRLARWLLLEHNEKQKQSGNQVWVTPEILSLGAWLKQAWAESWPESYFLTELQSKKLWQEIIQHDSGSPHLDLLHIQGAAEQAAKAYSLIKEYRLPVTRQTFSLTAESKAFWRWMQTYEQRLTEWRALDPATTLDAVQEAMSEGRIATPEKILLAGFEEITPQLQALIDFLKTKSVTILFDPDIPDRIPPSLASSARDRNIKFLQCKNQKEEAIQCARWIRSIYQPGKRVGVVVVDLKKYRSRLKRELGAELAPDSVFPWINKSLPFNLSLGTPLAEEPMVHVALQMLSIHKPVVPLLILLSVIKSTYLSAGQSESAQAFALQQKLCRNSVTRVFLTKANEIIDPSKAPELEKLLQEWKAFIQQEKRLLPSQWAKTVSNFLHSLGWPGGGRALNHREYQTYDAWKGGLDALASLDNILGTVSRQKAVSTLTAIAKEQPFQLKTIDSPIQVVGLLESSGMTFDHLWVMGCHADDLPALPSPNPFLPVEMRKNHRLPRSTPQRELEFAEHSLRRLIASAPNLVFSFPAWEGNTELKPSPFLDTIMQSKDKQPEDSLSTTSHRLKDQIFLAADLQIFNEPSCLPITEPERRHFQSNGLTGGYSVLKDQAECPFRAFANHRLNTRREELPDLDIDSKERGIWVHRALEFFWKETADLDSLLALVRENRLQERIHNAVKKTLEKQSAKFTQQERFYEQETQRMENLIEKWLHLEMQRSNFKVIYQEEERHVEISHMNLKLRIDRIDQTEDGKTILIDYKTGNTNPGDWFGERIKEPQLPLYAFHLPPDAIAFAQLKKGDMHLKGAMDPQADLTGFSTINLQTYSGCSTWDEMTDYWKTRIQFLADGFFAGETTVDPLEGTATCRYCHLQTLCRISERETGLAETEET